MNGVKENVEGVWTEMETGKEEVTKLGTAKEECKARHEEMTKMVKGMGEKLKEEIGSTKQS